MVCIYCQADTQVVNSRLQKRANRVWRRRKCIRCGNVVSTLESLDYATSVSFKGSQGRLQPFLRDKLFMSLHASLQHRKTALEDATALTDTVLGELPKILRDGIIERPLLISLTTEMLERFDTPAAVHYRAFHAD
jgi:transcriptional regulator NrdR family protein